MVSDVSGGEGGAIDEVVRRKIRLTVASASRRSVLAQATRQKVISSMAFRLGSTEVMTRLHAARSTGLLGLLVWAPSAFASYEVNIPPPASPIASQIYDLHMLILWVCVGIFVVVFGAMFYSLFKFRKSVGAKAEQWHENTTVEVIWTVIPFVILIAMAYPATKTVLDMKDASNPDMTVKVTAYQWKWSYEYMQDGVFFYSQLSTPRNQIDERDYGPQQRNENYLLEVDNEMVVPVGKRVRLLITAADVIHGWYVPQLGINQYGIPGFIKDAWFKADRPGVYRGQCSQICGKEHGYMPIVVRAVTEAEYKAWVDKSRKAGLITLAAKEAAAQQASVAAKQPPPASAKLMFAAGKPDMPADGGTLLAPLLDFAKANNAAKFFVSGYTDKTGNAKQNEELAKERAKAVRDALKAGGIGDDRIEMRKPEVITGSGKDEEARRVEVGLIVPGAEDPNKKWELADLAKRGEEVYAANCVACHQPTGKGMPPTFPALSGSKVVTGPKEGQIALLLNGKPGTAMASFARLSDTELAAVMTYTKNAWDNKTGAVIQPSEVKAARK
jgi:cytochrome c oxidase subunit II